MPTLTATVTVQDAAGHTATTTASATIAGTERERRAALLGVTMPGPGDVGVYSGVARAVVSSVAITAGGLVENKTITARVSPASNSGQTNAPFVIRNAEIVGPTTAPTGNDGILAAWGANHIPIVLEDCTIHAQAVHYFRNGAMGHHITMRGCEVFGGPDGFQVFNTNDPAGPTGVTVEGSWFHDSAWFDTDPAGTPGSATHNDTGLQIMGGSGTRIIGNRIDGFLAGGAVNTHGTTQSNSCIMIKPDTGTITDLVIRNNWLNGGRVPINLAGDGTARVLGSGIVISDNVFGHDADLGPDYSILMPAGLDVVTTGNVHTTGEPANVRRNG